MTNEQQNGGDPVLPPQQGLRLGRMPLLLLGAAGCLLALAVVFWLLAPPEDAGVLQGPVAPEPQGPSPRAFEEREPPLPDLDLDELHRPRSERPPEPAPLPELPPDEPEAAVPEAVEPGGVPAAPLDISSPAEAMQDVARQLLAHYRTVGGKGVFDLELYDLVDRYAPADLEQGMVYAVSPTAMRLVFMFTQSRFVEILRQEAGERLSPEAQAEFLTLLGRWLHGAAACPAALRQDRPMLAAPLDVQDCERSLKRLRGMLSSENLAEVENTAAILLQQLAQGLGSEAQDVSAAAEGGQ